MTGGSEFVILSNAGRGYTLVDGSYFAYENGGFYSSYNSAGNTLLGFYADSTSSVNFNTATIKANGNRIWHTGNHGSGSGLDADTIDGYHETAFVRLAPNSSTPTNGVFAIGSASGRNFIQSHLGQPLDLNPLGNAVFVGSNLTVSGTITELSSRRFKENIKPLESVLEKVEKLEPVTYTKTLIQEEEIGLIAEDVAELFPEVVTYDQDGTVQGIQYQRLSVILLKAVQELTDRITKLENK
jgi:hypothetical protein